MIVVSPRVLSSQQSIPHFPSDGQQSVTINFVIFYRRLLHEWNQVLCGPRDNFNLEILELTFQLPSSILTERRKRF